MPCGRSRAGGGTPAAGCTLGGGIATTSACHLASVARSNPNVAAAMPNESPGSMSQTTTRSQSMTEGTARAMRLTISSVDASSESEADSVSSAWAAVVCCRASRIARSESRAEAARRA